MHEAKARLSELIESAFTEGPQTVMRHGAERAVVLSIEDCRANADQDLSPLDFRHA